MKRWIPWILTGTVLLASVELSAHATARRLAMVLGGLEIVLSVWQTDEMKRLLARRSGSMRRQSRPRSAKDLATGADHWFGILSALLPNRLGVEELGDAQEDINQRVAAGRSPMEIRLKILATTFWVSLHAAEYLTKRLLKIMRVTEVIRALRGP